MSYPFIRHRYEVVSYGETGMGPSPSVIAGFPVVVATNTSVEAANTTSHDVSLPTGITAGDLLIVLLATDGSGASNISTTSEPGTRTWNKPLADENNSGGCNFGVRWRIADGGEGATATFTTGTSETSAHQSFRITGHNSALEAGDDVEGNTTTPNPPTLSPSWGAAKTLWIACFGADNDNDITVYPTDYTDGTYVESSVGAGSCSVGSARRELNAATEDPGTFTIAATAIHVVTTLAIQPAP